MRASLWNTSSTLSPDNADTSTATGISDFDAHLDASSAATSRPSGATLAFSCAPMPSVVLFTLPPASNEFGKTLLFELTELGVVGGTAESSSDRVSAPLARSNLLPTRRTVRSGEARARASARNGGSCSNVLCEVRS